MDKQLETKFIEEFNVNSLGQEGYEQWKPPRSPSKMLKFINSALTQAEERGRKEEREEIAKDYGHIKVVDSKTLRFYLLPHTKHLPSDDGR